MTSLDFCFKILPVLLAILSTGFGDCPHKNSGVNNGKIFSESNFFKPEEPEFWSEPLLEKEPMFKPDFFSPSKGPKSEAEYISLTKGPKPEAEYISLTKGPKLGKKFIPLTKRPKSEAEYISLSKGPESEAEYISLTKGPESEAEYISLTKEPESEEEYISLTKRPQSVAECNSPTKGSTPGVEYISMTKRPESEAEHISLTKGPKPGAEYISFPKGPESEEEYISLTKRPQSEAECNSVTKGSKPGVEYISMTKRPEAEAEYISLTKGPKTGAEYISFPKGPESEEEYISLTKRPQSEAECNSVTKGSKPGVEYISMMQLPNPGAEYISMTKRPEAEAEYISLTKGPKTGAEYISFPKGPESEEEYISLTKRPQSEAECNSVTKGSKPGVEYISMMQGPNPGVEYISMTKRPEAEAEYISLTKGPKPGAEYISFPKGPESEEEYISLTKRPHSEAECNSVTKGSKPGVEYISMMQGPNPGAEYISMTKRPESEAEYISLTKGPKPGAEYVLLTKLPKFGTKYISVPKRPKSEAEYISLTKGPVSEAEYTSLTKGPKPGVEFISLSKGPMVKPQYVSLGKYPKLESGDNSFDPMIFKPYSESASPHRSRECPFRYELLDRKNIRQAKELAKMCSENLFSCHGAELSKYRTIDGSCNNMKHPTWGKSEICYGRLLPYDYADGKSYPRESCTKKPLPNARFISNLLHKERQVKDGPYTTAFMTWGQIIVYDMTLNDVFRTPESGFSSPIDCCAFGPTTDNKCISLAIPKDDILAIKYGMSCMNIVRTVPCPCKSGVRQHWNQNTAYHDMSLVYGSNEDIARSLRTGSHGMLKAQYRHETGPLLKGAPQELLCVAENNTAQCFKTGDQRSNENLFILSSQTAFMRYHNLLCDTLHDLNPHWDDERLYQEARRILIAQAQVITFGQYLPLVLGQYMDKAGLNILPGAKCTEYVPNLDASIRDEFAAVAARYGHSQIPNSFSEICPITGHREQKMIADYYYRPFGFYEGQFDKVVKGMTVSKIGKTDMFAASSVRDFTNRRTYLNEKVGVDIAATTLLRGRDHGIPGYTYYLKHIFNITIGNFDDFRMMLPAEAVELLKQIYESVHDVELSAGGLAEYHVKGGLVGPTFASILAHQFKRIKFGDRYWFEHGHQAGSFTPDQLIEIKKTSLAGILCDTAHVESIQEFVFLPASRTNPIVSCENVPKINLYLWKDGEDHS